MISPTDALKKIHTYIEVEDIHAVYQAGMQDTSPLSDFDVVIVTNREISKPNLSGNELDIRGIYTKEVFAEKRALLPYTSLTLISGTAIPEKSISIPESDSNTIRLAAMFFRSFLRNFYDTRLDTDTRSLLVHLNDFEYAAAWLPELPSSTKSFLERIRTARISLQAEPSFRKEAIEESWKIVSILDTKLQALFPSTNASSIAGTLFVDSTERARILTEQHPFAAGRARILFLPKSFGFGTATITTPITQFANTYLKENTRMLPFIKQCIQTRIQQRIFSRSENRKLYLIDAFGFLINVFHDHLEAIFRFDLTPKPTEKVQKARWFAPRNFLTLLSMYWSGTMRKYSVVHFNRPESFLLFRKIPGQVSVFEIHGFDVGIMGKEYLKDLHTKWKRILGRFLDTLLSHRMIQKMQEPDILYVSTPDLVAPVQAWCGRTPEWLPNAIDVSLFSPVGPAKKLTGTPACFLAARLHGDKKPEVAFALFQNEILPHYPDAVLHLLDTGELAQEYKAKLGNDPHYEWHGYMDKPTLASVIRGSDLVFGDFSIGALSLLPMQVMATKRPIVSLDRYEILKEYSETLPELTRRLLSDTLFKVNFVEKNFRYVHDTHTAANISARHLSNLEKAGLKVAE